VTAANLTPAEKFRDEIGKLNKMAAVGAISWETYDRAVLKATGQLKDSIAAQMKLNQVTSGRRTVGALRRGSSAAFSASNASERAAQAAARAAQKQAELQRRTNDILKSIDNKTGVGAGGEDTTIIRNSIP
jgi:hypothetical protein